MSRRWWLEGFTRHPYNKVPSPFYRGRAMQIKRGNGVWPSAVLNEVPGVEGFSMNVDVSSGFWIGTGIAISHQVLKPLDDAVAGTTYHVDYGGANACEVEELFRGESQVSPVIEMGYYDESNELITQQVVMSNATAQLYVRWEATGGVSITETDLPAGSFGGHVEVGGTPTTGTVYWYPLGIYIHQQGRLFIDNCAYSEQNSTRFRTQIHVNGVERLALTTINHAGSITPTAGTNIPCRVQGIVPSRRTHNYVVDDFYLNTINAVGVPTDDKRRHTGIRIFQRPLERFTLFTGEDGLSPSDAEISLLRTISYASRIQDGDLPGPALDDAGNLREAHFILIDGALTNTSVEPEGFDWVLNTGSGANGTYDNPWSDGAAILGTVGYVGYDGTEIVPAHEVLQEGVGATARSWVVSSVHAENSVGATTKQFTFKMEGGTNQLGFFTLSSGEESDITQMQLGDDDGTDTSPKPVTDYDVQVEVAGSATPILLETHFTIEGMELREAYENFVATDYLLGSADRTFGICNPASAEPIPLPFGEQGDVNFGISGGPTTQLFNNFMDTISQLLPVYADKTGSATYFTDVLDMDGNKIVNLPATAADEDEAVLSVAEAKSIIGV